MKRVSQCPNCNEQQLGYLLRVDREEKKSTASCRGQVNRGRRNFHCHAFVHSDEATCSTSREAPRLSSRTCFWWSVDLSDCRQVRFAAMSSSVSWPRTATSEQQRKGEAYVFFKDSTMTEQPARSSSSLSNIPVPQAARREAKASSGLPTRTAASNGASSGPSRLPAKSASKPNVVLRATVASGSGGVSGTSRASTKSTGGLTLPRAPMTNKTNRPVAVGRVPSGMLPKGKVAVGPVRSAGSPGRGRISQDSNDSGRMEAIESRMTSMQDLFDMERRRTDDMMARAMKERELQEEKVRQLEEDLLEQRRLATRRKEEATRRKSIAEDEVRLLFL